ncbi:MAG: class I SAM-dependent methyltransferase [Fibrobacteria bacterium]
MNTIAGSLAAIEAEMADGFPLVAAMFRKNSRRYRAVAEWFMEKAVPKPSDRILDFGCGHPFMTRILRDQGLSVTAFEPFASEANEIRTAARLGLAEGFRTRLDEGERFEHILMVDVIEHLAVIAPIMKAVGALAAPGGSLTVSTPNVMRLDMWLAFVARSTGHPQPLETYLRSEDHFTHHQREFTLAELKRTVRFFGFRPGPADVVDTRPGAEDLARYHRLLGKPAAQADGVIARRIKNTVSEALIRNFPGRFANNLLLTARRDGDA